MIVLGEMLEAGISPGFLFGDKNMDYVDTMIRKKGYMDTLIVLRRNEYHAENDKIFSETVTGSKKIRYIV